MTHEEIKSGILSMGSNRIYQELTALFSKQNIFSVLKVERNENRHSAFLCWLLNPASEHGLGTEPLKKLLALYSFSSGKDSELNTLFLTGNYTVDVESCTTEKTVGSITGNGEKDRFDIWMLLTVTDNENNTFRVPLVIENKVSSNEGVAQTLKYHSAIMGYLSSETAPSPVEIFLSADKNKSCSCSDFTQITYQQILDNVIEPISHFPMSGETCSLIQAYIHNLYIPATKSLDDVKDPLKLSNTVLAVPGALKKNIEDLYNEYQDLFKAALVAEGGGKADKLFDKVKYGDDDLDLLCNFWENNISLFNTMLFVCKDVIAPGKTDKLMEIFATSRRDTSKYFVKWKKAGESQWRCVDGSEKPLSKGKCVALFFTKWLELNEKITIGEIRKLFPSSLNYYYSRNSESIVWFSKDGMTAESGSGRCVEIDKVTWDLYPLKRLDSSIFGHGLGYGPAYFDDQTDKMGFAMMVKMWRKRDFDNFIRHIEKNKDIFRNIRIEEA